jgi:predicted restriction endonuclease
MVMWGEVIMDVGAKNLHKAGRRPALEAAHIREFAELPEHSLNNGILFRADMHKLFDAGYVTVTPDRHFEVSRRIKEEFENGRDYYRLDGNEIGFPQNPGHHTQLKPFRGITSSATWGNSRSK